MKKTTFVVSLIYFLAAILMLSTFDILFYREVFVVAFLLMPVFYCMKGDIRALSFSLYVVASALLSRLIIPSIMNVDNSSFTPETYKVFMLPYAGLLMVTFMILYIAVTTVCIIVRMGKAATDAEEKGADGTVRIRAYNVIANVNIACVLLATLLCVPLYNMYGMMITVILSLLIHAVCIISFRHSKLDVINQIRTIREEKLKSE